MNKLVVHNALQSFDVSEMACALLRGENVVWNWSHDKEFVDGVLGELVFHGIEVLIYERLGQLAASPSRLTSELQEQVMARAVWEHQHARQLRELLTAMAAEGLEALLCKGTALAYSLYQNAFWRTRSDTDLLVAEDQRDQVLAVLGALGYAGAALGADVVYYQRDLSRQDLTGSYHHIDLHWRINNSELLSKLFSYLELHQRALPLEKLGEHAFGLGHVDALLFACVHRGAHKQAAYSGGGKTEFTGDRLIWCYDFDRLARALSDTQWSEFFQRAHSKGLATVASECLQLASLKFHTPLPSNWQARLLTNTRSPIDVYLAAGGLLRLWLDLLATEGLGAKIGYCWRLLFPPAAYMRQKYEAVAGIWLPLLYLRRMSEGIVKRLTVTGSN